MFKALLTTCAIAATAASTPSLAVELIQNGGFDQGLTGWTSYTTANGTIAEIPSSPGAPAPQEASVVSFDTGGSGASDALFLNAGVYMPPYGTQQQGGGVSQSFVTSGAGVVSFTADIAAYARVSVGNVGLLSVIVDGITLASYDFADITGGATERATLAFTTTLTGGSHTLQLQATRPFAPGRGIASQYFDTVSLDFAAAAVPEPASWAMMIAGFGLVGSALRRRKAADAFA